MSKTQISMGWAEADITPEQPVMLRGLFHARVSEGVMDPLGATVWALQSEGSDDHAVFVSCDLISIPDVLRDKVRTQLSKLRVAGLDPYKVIISATHTHTGPEVHEWFGVELDCMSVEDYQDFAAERIAQAIAEAWLTMKPGRLAYGMDYAVIGRNRRWVNDQGLGNIARIRGEAIDTFRYMEGYEDHSVNVAATYDEQGELTGLIVNVPCPSQLSQSEYVLSADFWHETRLALRAIHGEKLYILPQCSAAGELTPFARYDEKANERMRALRGRTDREEVAERIVQAVQAVLPFIADTAESSFIFKHHVETLAVPANELQEDEVHATIRETERWQQEFEQEMKKLEDNPELRQSPRWYTAVTNAWRRMNWNRRVARRYEAQKTDPYYPAEIHTLRIGDIAFTTVPYEYYLDFGIQMKVRSEATQTFIVQLTGSGGYLPSARSVSVGGYGSTAASNPVGPEGGQFIVEHTVKTIRQLFTTED